MGKSAGIMEKGLLAALDLAADTPWADLTLAAIAEKAGVSLSEFHGLAGKDDLIPEIDAWFDKAMSAEGVSGDEAARERLFDVIMLRFEAMQPYRAGLVSLMKYRDKTPAQLLRLPMARKQTADWALVSAGLDDSSGAPPGLKGVAIAFVVARTERAWRKETSGDFALTMAALDKGLRDAEDRMTRLQRFTRWGQKDSRDDTSTSDDASSETEA